MPNKPGRPDGDDGRTIADMSGVDKDFYRTRITGTLPDGRRQGGSPGGMSVRDGMRQDPAQDYYRQHQEQMDASDRRMYIFGAMGAAAAIGMVFLVAAFIAILIMVTVW